MERESNESGGDGASRMGALPEDFFEGDDRPTGPLPRLKGPAGIATATTAATPPAVVVRRPVLPVVGAVLLGAAVMFLSGLLSGWALARKDAATAGPVALPATVSDLRVGRLERSLDAKAGRQELDKIRATLAEVSRQVEQLGGRLESLPKPEPPPDLGPLRERIDALAKDQARLSEASESLRTLDERLGTLDESLGTFRNDLQALRDRVKAVESRPAPTPAESKPDPARVAEQAREQGLNLYRERKFAEARAAFLRGAESSAKDARLWYFAALANGFATGNWAGETERLVRLGIEAERGKTTPRAEIDAAFAGLPEDGGGRWLREWRQRAAGP